MKQTARESGRRRCCECRRWYTPDPHAKKQQKTCSKKCRLQRRAEQEKKRRAADLPEARTADRQRQQQYRARKRARGREKRSMSRTGLPVEMAEIVEITVEKLGQDQRLSQAGLRRLLRGLLRKNGLGSVLGPQKVGQECPMSQAGS